MCLGGADSGKPVDAPGVDAPGWVGALSADLAEAGAAAFAAAAPAGTGPGAGGWVV